MTDADLAAVRAQLAVSRTRVCLIDTPGSGAVIAKRQRPSRGPWRAHAVNALARLVGLSLLQAVPAPGGAKAQAIEVARLAALAGEGVRVPELLHVDVDFFVIRHLEGASLVQAIEKGGTGGFEAWQAGLDTLVEVHARGAYLSQAFARNFLVTPAGLGMIDFEDDPRQVMSLEEAQARDWLAYLHSTVWLLDRDSAAIRAAFVSRMAQERPEVRAQLARSASRLAFLRHLPRSRRAWGREVVGMQAAASLFHLSAIAPAKMHV
ncbi:MAG: hypothetical protein ABI460_18905 [Caldimonas sp.]